MIKPRRLHWFFLGLLYLVSSDLAFADGRFAVMPYANGQRVGDAAVCFFKGRSGDLFIDRFLTGREVRCYPADRTIHLPGGLWNFYVQHPTGWVTSHPFSVHVSEEGSAELRPLRVDLLAAATLDLSAARQSLQGDEYFALYLTNEGQARSRPAIRPLPADSSPVFVPAEMRTVLLIIRDEAIVWSGRPVIARAGETVKVPVPQRPSHDAIAIIRLDANVQAEDRQAVEGLAAPVVRLLRGSTIRLPSFALRTAPAFDTSLLLFEDVPPGDYTLEASGEYWLTDRLPLTVRSQRGDIPQSARPLTTRPRSRIEVEWSTARETERETIERTCEGSRSLRTTLTIIRCSFGFERSSPGDCTPAAEATLEHKNMGIYIFDKVEPGAYYVELARGHAREHSSVSVPVGRVARAKVALEATYVTGRVTRSTKPISALVRFATGEAVSDAITGEYRALITRSPDQQPIHVTPCDSHREFIDVPSHEISLGDRYDLEIPANRLEIRTVDGTTGQPLSRSRVTSRLQTPDQTVAMRYVGETNVDGIAVDEGLSPNAAFEICAHLDGYEVACSKGVHLTHDEDTLTIKLMRSSKRAVRLVSESDIGAGRVYVAVGSTIIGESDIEHRDTVRLDVSTPANAYLYITALGYPLTRVRVPDLSLTAPIVQLHAIRGVTFSVTLPRESHHNGGPIGLELNAVPVPSRILQFFQQIRGGSAAQIRPGETIQIGPIDDTLPLGILLWRWSKDLPSDLRTADPFGNAEVTRLMYRVQVNNSQVVLSP